MLTSPKKQKLVQNLKSFNKKYFTKKLADLDESGTRLLINDLLHNVLGYQMLEEIKTEYMIRGTYADYLVQTKGIRHFLVEVKALSLSLSDKHLRQTIEYGVNEGIDWALLTNGREVHFYKIIFAKPVDARLVFKIDLGDASKIKENVECLQYFHRDAVVKKSLDMLWNRFTALEIYTIAGLLFNNTIIGFLKRQLRSKFKSKFEEREVREALTNMIASPVNMERVKISGSKKAKTKSKSTIVVVNNPAQSDVVVVNTN